MKLNPQIISPIITGIIVLVVIWLAFKWIIGKSSIDEIRKDLDKTNLSYDEAQYYIYADSIQAATQSMLGDDEQAIYSVFEEMNNSDDVKMLIVAFGNRTYWAGSGFFYNATLNEVLQTVLEQSEIYHINNILSQKSINITI